MSTSMLTGLGTRVPNQGDLLDVELALADAVGPTEHLAMSLRKLVDEDEFEVTAEQAWALTHFARGLRLTAETLKDSARAIDTAADGLYQNGFDRHWRESC